MHLQFTKSKPTIAVCLAAYNGRRWLAEQLDSILNQDGVSVTIFVSVDRSTDGTEQWIDRRATEDSRIVVLQHGKSFGGAAKNFFRLLRDVDFEKFDYVSLADQDDIWLPRKLIRAHVMLANTGAAAYSSNVVAFWPSGQEVLIKKSQPQQRWDFLFEAAGPGCTYVMRTQLAVAVQKMIREQWSAVQRVALHDWLIYAFARANGYRWIIDDEAGMRYRQHGENQVGVNSGWAAFIHRARKILSGWGLAQAALVARLVGLENEPFVARWIGFSRLGVLGLAIRAGQCRRRRRDQVLFAVSCLMLCVIGIQ